MFLPCMTEIERNELILIDETKVKYGYNPATLGRHSGQMVVFKCIVCTLPFDNTKKKVLDKKGLTHPGECRLAVRKDAGQRSRQTEDPKHKETRKQKLREKIAKDKDLIVSKRQKTLIDRYGSKNLSEIDSIRKNISKGIKKAFVDKGKDIIDQRKQTNLEKYGSTNFLTSEEGLQNLIQKNQEKLGVDYPFQNKDFQTEARNKYIAELGFQNPSHDPSVNAKRNATNINTGFIKTLSTGERVSDFCTKKGIKHSNAFKILRTFGEETLLEYIELGPTMSSLEILFRNLLRNEFPDLTHYNCHPQEAPSLNYKPDFRIEHNNRTLYINVDGLYWHSKLEKSDDNYHSKIRQLFNNSNLSIIQFRENEVINKSDIVKSIVINKFGMSKKYNARSCSVKQIDYSAAKPFFEINHLMGYVSATTFGLHHNEELVCAISVKRKDDSIEISRFGSKNFCNVRGGFSKLLNYVIKIYNPKTIISFCDLRYADGHSYEKLGFKRVSISQGWEWTDLQSTFNRRKCRANMDDRRLSEKEYAEEKGWVKIYDAGQAKYIKEL